MVGIIILNYKEYAKRFLAECRDSLYAQTYLNEDFKVYIVDNASSEESRAYLRKVYPQAEIIPRPDGNYTEGNNVGVDEAIKDGCDLFVLANMDTKFDPHWLQELVNAVESDPKIGIAQSKMILYPKEGEPERINSVGNILHYLGFGYTKGYNEPADQYMNQEIVDVPFYPSGCSIIITKHTLDRIGLYDKKYYMYHDDIELGWKAKLAGIRAVLAPKSVMYHKYEFSRSVRMFYYMERNRWISLFSFYKLPTLLVFAPALVVMDLGLWLYSLTNGTFLTKLKVVGYFFKPSSWRHIKGKRRKVREIRVKKDREILKDLTGEIKFQEIENSLLKYIGNPLINSYFKIVRRIIYW